MVGHDGVPLGLGHDGVPLGLGHDGIPMGLGHNCVLLGLGHVLHRPLLLLFNLWRKGGGSAGLVIVVEGGPGADILKVDFFALSQLYF